MAIYAESLNKWRKLIIVAHPDDELVFGGAELIKYGEQYKVVCFQKNNPPITIYK